MGNEHEDQLDLFDYVEDFIKQYRKNYKTLRNQNNVVLRRLDVIEDIIVKLWKQDNEQS